LALPPRGAVSSSAPPNQNPFDSPAAKPKEPNPFEDASAPQKPKDPNPFEDSSPDSPKKSSPISVANPFDAGATEPKNNPFDSKPKVKNPFEGENQENPFDSPASPEIPPSKDLSPSKEPSSRLRFSSFSSASEQRAPSIQSTPEPSKEQKEDIDPFALPKRTAIPAQKPSSPSGETPNPFGEDPEEEDNPFVLPKKKVVPRPTPFDDDPSGSKSTPNPFIEEEKNPDQEDPFQPPSRKKPSSVVVASVEVSVSAPAPAPAPVSPRNATPFDDPVPASPSSSHPSVALPAEEDQEDRDPFSLPKRVASPASLEKTSHQSSLEEPSSDIILPGLPLPGGKNQPASIAKDPNPFDDMSVHDVPNPFDDNDIEPSRSRAPSIISSRSLGSLRDDDEHEEEPAEEAKDQPSSSKKEKEQLKKEKREQKERERLEKEKEKQDKKKKEKEKKGLRSLKAQSKVAFSSLSLSLSLSLIFLCSIFLVYIQGPWNIFLKVHFEPEEDKPSEGTLTLEVEDMKNFSGPMYSKRTHVYVKSYLLLSTQPIKVIIASRFSFPFPYSASAF